MLKYVTGYSDNVIAESIIFIIVKYFWIEYWWPKNFYSSSGEATLKSEKEDDDEDKILKIVSSFNITTTSGFSWR
jgi:hypothetical protein